MSTLWCRHGLSWQKFLQKSTLQKGALLTLKWPRYFYSRWCPRGVPWTPQKTTFLPEFCNEIWTKFSPFLFRVISILAKFWQNHFPKGIFQWNLAQRRRTWIDSHYWNNILKIFFRFKMLAKTNFWYCTIMLIYAN